MPPISEPLDKSTELKDLASELRSGIRSGLYDMIGDTESPYVKEILNQSLIDVTHLWMQLIDASNSLIEIHNASADQRK